MRAREKYWGDKAPSTPQIQDLPAGTFLGTAEDWEMLTPAYRRCIWRAAVLQEAQQRGLPEWKIDKLKTMLIDGTLSCLDDYLCVIEKSAPLHEDQMLIARADAQSAVAGTQILAREAL